MQPTGVPAHELTDKELERQGTHAHATRNWVFLHGTAEQFRHHTERMHELEQEYLRRYPKRTWQGAAGDSAEVDEVSRLRAALRGVVTQIEALLSEPSPQPGPGPSAAAAADAGRPAASAGAGVGALLAEVAAAPDGRVHRLELHQLARAHGVPPAELAQLYRADPALLAVDGQGRCITPAGRAAVP
jgi:hypothetical protein